MANREASGRPELNVPEIEFESAACALCGSEAADGVLEGGDRLHGRTGRFQVVKCRSCGLMRTNPRPTARCISHYYPPDYEPYLETASEDLHRGRRALSRLLNSLDVAIPPLAPGDMLEVGAAGGNFLLAMQRAGWRVTGIEFDRKSAAIAARRTGATVHGCDLMDVQFPPESFDLVCGWMVFEHLRDPVAAFERVRIWLRPGGWLAFSVPDAGSWQFRAFGDAWFALQLPTHLYHFTDATIRAVLVSRGFEDLSIRWQRTLFDVAVSSGYRIDDLSVLPAGLAQRVARSSPVRALARAFGAFAGPLHLTGRLTVWARRPL